MIILKYVFRNLWKNKTSTIVNIVGLSLGMATFFILLLYAQHEMGYDKQFSHYDRIFRITSSIVSPDGTQDIALAALPLKDLLKDNYPEIEETAVILELPEEESLRYKNTEFRQGGFRNASSNIFNVLDYKSIAGDLSIALTEPNSVVLTESVAQKLMGKEMDTNKEILINDEPYKVTAILADLPKNMDLQFAGLYPGYKETSDDMLDFDGFLYVKTLTGNDQKIQSILRDVEQKYYVPLKEDLAGIEIKLGAQPISDIHFSSELLADSPKGNIKYLYFFSIIGIVVLVIACVNYINLSNARFIEKNYFQEICKINSAGKYQSLIYTIIESGLLVVVSYIISTVIVLLLLPFLNHLSNKDIELFRIYNPHFIGISLLIIMAVITFVSVLPFTFGSIFRYRIGSNVLLKAGTTNKKSFRGGMVVIQFVSTIILILCVFVFQRQMNFMKKKDLGFDLHNVITIGIPFDTANYSKVHEFENRLSQFPEVQKISNIYGGAVPGILYGGYKMIHAAETNGELKQFIVSFIDVDDKYMDLLGLELVEGEPFVDEPWSNADKCIINETYSRAMGIEDDPLGQPIPEGNLRVAGVVKDFHYLSPQNPIEPVCIRYQSGFPGALMIKGGFNALTKAKNLWKEVFPNQPFTYGFVEDTYNQQYFSDKQVFKIVMVFAGLSIFISILGMLGLVQYSCERNIKNIGIRKICGADKLEILVHLNIRFVKQIIIAMIIASPLAYIILDKWLQRFAYRIEIAPLEFILSGIVVLSFTVFIVTSIGWKTTKRNPVEALRYE